jgi:hypothetical protein
LAIETSLDWLFALLVTIALFALGSAILRCPSNFAFQGAALMPPWIAEQHAC